MKYLLTILSSVIAIPLSAHVSTPQDFKGFVHILLHIMYLIVPILITGALFAFFWGLVKFIYSAGSEEAIKDGKNLMVWGIIALTVMISVWGIIALLSSSFGFGLPIVPTLPEA